MLEVTHNSPPTEVLTISFRQRPVGALRENTQCQEQSSDGVPVVPDRDRWDPSRSSPHTA